MYAILCPCRLAVYTTPWENRDIHLPVGCAHLKVGRHSLGRITPDTPWSLTYLGRAAHGALLNSASPHEAFREAPPLKHMVANRAG